ncbi:MAG: hypothetical protein EpisKO_41290 [Epibacterium sp.]
MSNQSIQPFQQPSPKALAASTMTAGAGIAAMVPQNLDDAFRLSKALAAAGDMVPQNFRGNPEATMAAILRGIEVGLPPMQALSSIAVINGRASLWGDAIPALMQRAGHHLDTVVVGSGDDMKAVAELTRGDTGKTYTREFSVQDAKDANLWGKAGPWKQYPKRMLTNRARSWAARDGAADALMGLQIAEEMQDVPAPRDVTPKPGGFASIAQKARQQAAQGASPEPAQEAEEDPHTLDGEVLPSEEGNAPAENQGSESGGAIERTFEFDEGATAFREGKMASDCPYEMGDQLRDWRAGWSHAYDQANPQEDEQ